MKKNYEIKCKLADAKSIRAIISSLKKYSHSIEKQTDIYYKVRTGRLKLRIINDTDGSLIFYERDEQTSKRISRYVISKTRDHKDLSYILKNQFEILVTVVKKRKIFIYRNIRIHIDTVKDLGKFLEIEIIYENFSKAKRQMKELIHKLNLDEKSFIKGSYSDLLINRK